VTIRLTLSASERQPPVEHLEQQHADRVEIAPRRRGLAERHLGRQVRRRADHAPRLRDGRLVGVDDLGQPEVEDLHQIAAGRIVEDHHVGRLEIAVDDAEPMRGLERVAHLDRDAHGAVAPEAAVARSTSARVRPRSSSITRYSMPSSV
jgi:hypothetical protein